MNEILVLKRTKPDADDGMFGCYTGTIECAVTNTLKAAAAKKFCKKNGYEYEMVEAKRMKNDQILDLYKKGLIKFIDRYEVKFKERYLDGKK